MIRAGIGLLIASLALATPDAFAQKGKSYSSGSSSSRPSSSSSSKGKSYSSGSSGSRPSSSSGSRPSSSSSSTSRPSSSSSRPSSSSYDSRAASGAKRAESRTDYRSSPNVPGVPGRSESVPRGSGKSYSEGNWSYNPQPKFTPGGSARTTYNDSKGQSRTIEEKHRPSVDNIRRTVNEDRYYDRSARRDRVFVNVGPPVGYSTVVYNDPYSNIFWWWLLSQSLDYRANWAYHHRYSMDNLRYSDLMARDQAMATRIRELEAQNAARDPTWTPKGVDPDLMYTDEYVDAAVNPSFVTPARPRSGILGGLGRMCCIVILIGVICFALIWFVFIKRWGGT